MRTRRIRATAAAAAIMLPLLAAAPAVAATQTGAAVPAAVRAGPSDCEVEKAPVNTTVPWAQTQTRYLEIWRKFHDQGQGVTVAVVDTGFEPRHPQMRNVRTELGKDFTGNTQGLDWDNDCDGHGTGVASVIAAQTCSACVDENADKVDIPFAGVAPRATLMPLRVSNLRDEGITNIAIAAAIQYAVDNDADIINVSLETQQDWPDTRKAVEAALAKGIIIVAAAGNHGSQVAYPAKYASEFPNVISVGAIGDDGTMMEASGKASNATIVAPGKGMHTAQSVFGHKAEDGTSFAAPFVSGVVALMKVRFPDFTPAQIRQRLELTAIRPGVDVPDPQRGYGMIDPVAALTSILPANIDTKPKVPTGQVIPDIPQPVAADNTIKDRALLTFGIAAGLALVTLGFVTVYRRGKARGWRPGTAHRSGSTS